MLAWSPPQILLTKDFKVHEWMEVESASNVKFFKLYPSGTEAKSWNKIGSSRFVRSQSMATIFLAPNHTGDVHNALVTRYPNDIQRKKHAYLSNNGVAP